MEVTISDILSARDRRVEKQKQLLKKYGKPLICFTINIAGPEKNNELIEKAFCIGLELIKSELCGNNMKVLHLESECVFTGCTAYLAVEGEAESIKKITVKIEDTTPAGRLFDIDVLASTGEKISRCELGLMPRKCLLCDKAAAICGRQRAHSLDELKKRTDELLKLAINE